MTDCNQIFFPAVNDEIPDINFRENGYLYLAGHRSKHVLEQNNATQLSCGADWMDLLNATQLGALSHRDIDYDI